MQTEKVAERKKAKKAIGRRKKGDRNTETEREKKETDRGRERNREYGKPKKSKDPYYTPSLFS